MEHSDTTTISGQISAMAKVLETLVATLERLPAAQVAMQLAIEAESVRQAANRSPADETMLKLLIAYRDLAQSVSRGH